jgi:hypothetical protein
MFEKPEPIVGAAKESRLDMEELPAAEVKNRVLFANPSIHAPFEFTEGEPTKLGLFLKPEAGKSFMERITARFLGSKTKKVGAMSGHGRSAILGRVVFDDDEGRMYRDVDLKGIGSIIPEKNTVGIGRIFEKASDGTKEAYGLLRLSSAYHDRDMSEAFLAAGIRTHRIVAIISLSEIIDANGDKITIEDAQREGKIPESIKPVISVRAYGTKYRFDDLTDIEKVHSYSAGELRDLKQSDSNKEIKSNLLDDAMAMVAQELGRKPEEFSKQEYAEWLANTIGTSVGRMHKNGWYHGYLKTHNFTLDGRITDLDSVGWLSRSGSNEGAGKEVDHIGEDIGDMKKSLADFFEVIGLKDEIEKLTQAAMDAYRKENI